MGIVNVLVLLTIICVTCIALRMLIVNLQENLLQF